MARQVEFQGSVHEFPDNATDEQIRTALAGHHEAQADALTQWSQKHPVLAAPLDLIQGIGAGVMSTVRGASQLAHKVVPAIPVVPEAMATAPDSFMGKAGKFAEQGAEFLAPAAAGLKVGKAAGLAARLGGEALTAGGVSLVQSGGDLKSAGESAATVGALGALGAAVPKVARSVAIPAVQRIIDASPRPLSTAAKDLAEKYGVPLTRGMEGGSPTVQRTERILGTTVAPDLYEGLVEKGQQGLKAGANDLTNNFAVDKFAAGDRTIGRLIDTAKEHERIAQDAYSQLEQLEANPANLKTVQTGVDAAGKPVLEDIALPVDMRSVKAQLKPIADRIRQQLPVAQQQYSKGLHAVQQILEGADAVSASTAEANLSAVKQIQREAVDGRVKMLTGRALDAMQPAVDDAIAQAGPKGVMAIQDARYAWKQHANVMDLVEQLSGDRTGAQGQVKAASRLLMPGDQSFPLIRKVLDIAPDSADDLGKSLLGKIFDKAETGEFTNPKTAANLWNRIGPRTKDAIFSPDQRRDITAFLELAGRVAENPNPSGTGTMNALLKAGVLITHPVQGTAALTFGRNLAKVLYEPEGAAALKVALRGGPPGEVSSAMSVIKALAAKGAERDAALLPAGTP